MKKSTGHPTLQSIAQTLGLSRTTVSEILGGDDRYAEETRLKVLDVARSLNYQPNRSAQIVRRGRSNLIGVIHFGGAPPSGQRTRFFSRPLYCTNGI